MSHAASTVVSGRIALGIDGKIFVINAWIEVNGDDIDTAGHELRYLR